MSEGRGSNADGGWGIEVQSYVDIYIVIQCNTLYIVILYILYIYHIYIIMLLHMVLYIYTYVDVCVCDMV